MFSFRTSCSCVCSFPFSLLPSPFTIRLPFISVYMQHNSYSRMAACKQIARDFLQYSALKCHSFFNSLVYFYHNHVISLLTFCLLTHFFFLWYGQTRHGTVVKMYYSSLSLAWSPLVRCAKSHLFFPLSPHPLRSPSIHLFRSDAMVNVYSKRKCMDAAFFIPYAHMDAFLSCIQRQCNYCDPPFILLHNFLLIFIFIGWLFPTVPEWYAVLDIFYPIKIYSNSVNATRVNILFDFQN